ncbi:MAG: hypothetical protein HQK86_12865 [Nitrospinae bacterium]|nr:hypothetical protein [Nitrospinota bacterium]
MQNIVFGLVAIALGLWGLSAWWYSVLDVLRGFIPPALVLLGLVAIGAGMRPSESDGDEDDDDKDSLRDE